MGKLVFGMMPSLDGYIAGAADGTQLPPPLSDVLNPKVALFFLALLPQFVDRTAAHPTLQIILLGVTVNAIGLPTNIALVYGSAWVTGALRRNQSASQWLGRGLGVLFVALGLRIAVEKI